MDTQALGKIALQRAIHEHFALSRAHVSRLVNGGKKPSLKLAADIEDKLGVPASAWTNGNPAAEMFRIILERENDKA